MKFKKTTCNNLKILYNILVCFIAEHANPCNGKKFFLKLLCKFAASRFALWQTKRGVDVVVASCFIGIFFYFISLRHVRGPLYPVYTMKQTYAPFTRSSWLDELAIIAGRATSMFASSYKRAGTRKVNISADVAVGVAARVGRPAVQSRCRVACPRTDLGNRFVADQADADRSHCTCYRPSRGVPSTNQSNKQPFSCSFSCVE